MRKAWRYGQFGLYLDIVFVQHIYKSEQYLIYIVHINARVKIYGISGLVYRKRPSVSVIYIASRRGKDYVAYDRTLYLVIVIAAVGYLQVVKMHHKHRKHTQYHKVHYNYTQIYPARKPVKRIFHQKASPCKIRKLSSYTSRFLQDICLYKHKDCTRLSLRAHCRPFRAVLSL